jgi:hypothetical protein
MAASLDNMKGRWDLIAAISSDQPRGKAAVGRERGVNVRAALDFLKEIEQGLRAEGVELADMPLTAQL